MNLPYSVNQEELFDLLINLSPSRPIFIWGSPGIGKSALVEKLAKVAEDIIFGVTADESLEKIFVVMVMKEI